MEQRVLILAPRGRDAKVIEQVLAPRGLACKICSGLPALVTELEADAALALIAEEALVADDLAPLLRWLKHQPVWSDFPFVLLTSGEAGQMRGSSATLAEQLGNVVLLERPIKAETLVSAASSALRARRRQYQARGHLAERVAVEERLKEADRRKDEFLAMLAHELRNPLAPIRNAAEAIKFLEPQSPPRLSWARELIERQSKHLSSLLEDLLDVSRITTGKIALKRAEVDINTIVLRAIETVQPALDTRQHTLLVELPEVPVYVYGDAIRLTQVIGNLLDNAAKYTPAGGRIEVRVSVTNGSLSLLVEDNGVGIPAADLPYIFQLFSQANRALDRAQGGLGIGLSVVRSLLEMHGGSITASSAGRGKGTRFIVTLGTMNPLAAQPAKPALPSNAARRSLEVVVVDDNVDSAESLAMLLEINGDHVHTAFDGPSGLQVCHACVPDVVLLDIGLPGMDGYEVAAKLRESDVTRNAMLIALTGYGQADDIRRSKEAGFDHHMVKPVEPDELAVLFRSISGDQQRAGDRRV